MKLALDNIKTLVVRCPTWVGDIVMATPVFDCLRQNLPKARLVAVLKPGAQGILRDGPWFDEIIEGQDKSWAGFIRMRRAVRAWHPDAALLLPNSFRSALTMRLSGIRTLYGYRRQGRGLLLTGGPVPLRDGHGAIVPIPMLDYYIEICRFLGLDLPEPLKPTLYVGPELRERGAAFFKKHGVAAGDFLVGLNPGASFGSSKCWPAESFAELADLCQKNLKARIILFSGPGEEAIAQAVLQRTRADIINARDDGVGLEMLKPLVQRCNLMITNDTGPRHYAVALDVPVVVIMGSTDPRYTNANLDHTVLVRKELDCSPCHKKVCPKQHECMKAITPGEVFAAAETLLSGRA